MQQHSQNLQHQDKIQDKYIVTCKIENFVICVDPDSKQVYGLNPQTNDLYIFLDEKQQNKVDYQNDQIHCEEMSNIKFLNKLREEYLQSQDKLLQDQHQQQQKQQNSNNGNNNAVNGNVIADRSSKQLSVSQQQPPQLSSQYSQQQQPQQQQQQQVAQFKQSTDAVNVPKENESFTLKDYRKKGLDAIKSIEEIIHLNQGHWLISHERADQYRRRKLPNYLLQRTDQNHPTYICQSPLSEVFVNQKSIKMEVNLKYVQRQVKLPSIEIEVGLVTAADEVLKNILRTVYQKTKQKLQPDENKTFILKIEGYREYLSGHYPMLSYDRVRTNLRNKENVKVILDQKQNQIENQKQFPPDFERLNECKFQQFHRSEKSIEDVKNLLRVIQKDIIFKGGKVKQLYLNNNYKIIDNTNHIIFQDQFNINWKDYQQIPALLWYAPQKLPQYIEDLNFEQNIENLVYQQTELQRRLQQSQDDLNQYKNKYLKLYKETKGFLFTSDQDRFWTIQDNLTTQNQLTTTTNQDQATHQDELFLKSSPGLSSVQHSKPQSQHDLYENGEGDADYIEDEGDEEIIQRGKDKLQKTYQDFYKLKEVQCKLDPNRFLRGCQQAEKFAKQFLGEGQQNDLKLRVIHKERMKELIEKRRNLMGQKIFSEKPTNLYSGECDWIFKLKIKGIENLYRIFQQADLSLDDNCRATYNGILPPVYITKHGEWRKAIEHEEKIKIPQRIDGTPNPVMRLSKVNPQKFEEKPVHKKQEEQQNIIPQHQKSAIGQDHGAHGNVRLNQPPENFSFKFASDHGDKGSNYFKQIQQYYDLNFPPYFIQIQVKLMYGNRALSYKKETQKIPFSRSPRWDEWVKFPLIKISQLPLESRICLDVIVYSNTGLESQTIGSTTFYIFDQYCKFTQGITPLNLWPFSASEDRLACSGQYYGLLTPLKQLNDKLDQRDFYAWESFKAKEYSRLFIELDTFQKHMYWSLRDDKTMIQLEFQNAKNRLEDLWVYTPQNQYLAELKELLRRDPINRNFDMRQKLILLICRNHFKSIHQALDIFLCAVDWSNPEHIRETYNLLKQWKSPPSEECITFLDAHHADEVIRLYGVERISKMADDEIKLYMVTIHTSLELLNNIELVQALMFENNHYSPIQELLLERSLLNPFVVGHELFWSLKSQLHLKASYERYALFLEQLLMLSGEYRTELLKEVKINEDLKKIARNVKKARNNVDARSVLEKDLKKLKKRYTQNSDEIEFTFAIDNRLQLHDFALEKCRIMNSKKKPLWLAMINNENKGKAFYIMFKDGDDLRQDILTLQLIRIMDKIWLDNNLDLRMKPYNVVATLDQVGMLEIVRDSQTTAAIHKKNNQRFGCLLSESIQKYLKENNKDNYQLARENFRSSCAGYCVATYILGIGDRHSDNIMITNEGHFFHIDFGHFLGNFKKKFGINRERSPFVFTKVMEHVMLENKEDYQVFEEMCCKAYNLIRKHGNFFINIFRMMLSAGMPELQRESDIEYLVETLQLNLSDKEAEQHFKKQIRIAREDKFKLFDNFIHEIVKK